MKDKLLVTVSGGRSSGYMAIELFNNYKDIYDMYFIYANTGQEHEKTLDFIHNIENVFGLPIVWIESIVNEAGVGTTYKIVNYETASRKGEPFEDVIKKYGLPNPNYMHCTRELKIQPITAYMRDNKIKVRTLGIRYDEPNRYNPNVHHFYPLYDWKITKKHINNWWKKQVFDLEIPDYLGNCVTCYKKSDKKLNIIANEEPFRFDFFLEMENKYPDDRRQIFRGYRTTQDIIDNKTVGLFDDVCAEECGTVIMDDLTPKEGNT